ncbi:hypothetical protein [Streptomyces syringium]|uniref:hypothetical protein n=1 Tax=Streptomyces syringium TaxID=76729 RepID=UPI00343D6267
MRLLGYMVQAGDLLVGDGDSGSREIAAVRRRPGRHAVVLVFTSGQPLKVGAMDTLRVTRAWPVVGPTPGGPPCAPGG